MKTKTSTRSIIRSVRALKAGTALFALASVIPLVLAANASEKPAAAAQGEPAPATHSGAESRVFGNNTPAHEPADTAVAAATDHGAPAPAHGAAAPALGASSNAGHASPWAYSGDTGPDYWGAIKSEYALCGAGQMQSPVNLSGGLEVSAAGIDFNYKLTDLTIGNNGHTVQVDYTAGSHIVVNGHRFDLLQLHFHTPSEHLIDGKKYPMEMHLVHKDAGGALAVVGLMMEMGESNIALAEIWNHLPGQAGDPARIDGVAVNARDLLPENASYHHYKGSLTTPPCSEGVNWFVLDQPVQVSAAQIKQFTDIIGDNARPAQATHQRLLVSSK